MRQVTAGIRTTIALQILGQDGRPLLPDLYEPRLTNCTGQCMVFTGMECVDQAWVAQEWTCELVGDEDVAGFGNRVLTKPQRPKNPRNQLPCRLAMACSVPMAIMRAQELLAAKLSSVHTSSADSRMRSCSSATSIE